MSPKDYRLWQTFRRQGFPNVTALYFDVALGKGVIPESPTQHAVDAMWTRVTSFRADLITESPTAWEIIELRDNAGAGALGQLLVYADLWISDPPDDRPLHLRLVTNSHHPELGPTLAAHRINVTLA
jgi:hypothetical protein